MANKSHTYDVTWKYVTDEFGDPKDEHVTEVSATSAERAISKAHKEIADNFGTEKRDVLILEAVIQ